MGSRITPFGKSLALAAAVSLALEAEKHADGEVLRKRPDCEDVPVEPIPNNRAARRRARRVKRKRVKI